MRTDAHTGTKLAMMMLALLLVLAAVSCGGGGGTVSLDSSGTEAGPGNVASSDVNKGVGLLITEEEIPTLPAWQQQLLSDPGWNQPYIEPAPKTEVDAPTSAMLLEAYGEMLDNPPAVVPRGEGGSGTKGASWMDQKNFDGELSIARGEYEEVLNDDDPIPFGCNVDRLLTGRSNGSGNNYALEDIIQEADKATLPQKVSFVEVGHATRNYFVDTAGSINDSRSAIYQLFGSERDRDPALWEEYDQQLFDGIIAQRVKFEEISYRADMIYTGAEITAGDNAEGKATGDCQGAEAYLVSDRFWKRFNSEFNVLPTMATTALYNVLVAPSSDASGWTMNDTDVEGAYQSFYLGDVEGCYNNAWIVGLKSAATGCATFDNSVADAYDNWHPYHYTPIYGALLARWQDLRPDTDDPWNSFLGWPVYGPKAYHGGSSRVGSNGATYYTWGLWFERGFMWWIDYDQRAFPETVDEVQLFRYPGNNVFCDELVYEPVEPTVRYGTGGDLGVTVVPTEYQYPSAGTHPWTPVPFNTDEDEYRIGLPSEDPLVAPSGYNVVNVKMSALPYGGNPDNCEYAHYTWAFRDGQIFMGDEAAAKHVTHQYGSLDMNMMNTYVVRVQVVDRLDATGEIGYGDSYPINIGAGGAGAADILIIRHDDGNYDADLQTITDDLDALGVGYAVEDYTDTIADTYIDGEYKACIWFRSGGESEGDGTAPGSMWTEAQSDNYLRILENAGNMLFYSRSHGWDYQDFNWLNNTYNLYGIFYQAAWLFAKPPLGVIGYPGTDIGRNMTFDDNQTNADMRIPESVGLFAGYAQLVWETLPNPDRCYFAWNYPMNFMFSSGFDYGLKREGSGNSTGCAEMSGASGKVPISMMLNDDNGWQSCPLGLDTSTSNPWASSYVHPQFQPGFFFDPPAQDQIFGTRDVGMLSYGLEVAPDGPGSDWSNPRIWVGVGPPPGPHSDGPGRLWTVSYPWMYVEGASTDGSNMDMSRAEVLWNILFWLNEDIDASAPAGSGAADNWTPYVGDPEILQVMPYTWEDNPDPGGDPYEGAYWNGAAMTAWYDSAAGGGAGAWIGHYPDQTMYDLYRDNAFGGTHPQDGYTAVLTTGAAHGGNEDWVNGNDVDFAFPWYAYIIDTDHGNADTAEVDMGLSDAENDDAVIYGGLLLNDDGAGGGTTGWLRLQNLATPVTEVAYMNSTDLVDYSDIPTVVMTGGYNVTSALQAAELYDFPINVAGYYFNDTLDTFDYNAGDDKFEFTGDTAVRAHMGETLPQLTFDNQDELWVEAVAHWTPGTELAPLLWSMYPGHKVIDPASGQDIGDVDAGGVEWDVYRATFDVDPGTAPALRATGPWNRPQFYTIDGRYGGRIQSFDYRTVETWNGDLNMDGQRLLPGTETGDPADKFPVRCRFLLAATYSTYGDWPDHMSDPGSEPVDGYMADGEFIEGGCYVVDTGAPVYHYTVELYKGDNYPEQSGVDPYPDYTVDVNYEIFGGTGDYEMEFYFVPTSEPIDLSGTWYEVIDPAVTHTDPGVYTSTVTCNAANTTEMNGATPVGAAALPPGNYYLVAHVNDTGDADPLTNWAEVTWSTDAIEIYDPPAFEEDWEHTDEPGSAGSQWTLSGSVGSGRPYSPYSDATDWKLDTSWDGDRWGYGTEWTGGYGGTSKFVHYGEDTRSNGFDSYGYNVNRQCTSDNFALNSGNLYTFTFRTRGMTYFYAQLAVGIDRGDGSFYYNMPGTTSSSYYWSGGPAHYYGYRYYHPHMGYSSWQNRVYNFTALGTTGQINLWFRNTSTVDYYGGPAVDEIIVE